MLTNRETGSGKESKAVFGRRLAVSAIVVAALALAAVPVAIALDVYVFDDGVNVVTVEGTVTEFVCCKVYFDDEMDYCDCDECDDRAGAFILVTDDGDEYLVEFGPWWYWDTQETTVRDIVTDKAIANDLLIAVTGEFHEKDGVLVLEAWTITNEKTGDDITIKVEGCPPWTGGPEELGVEPWPPSDEDDG
ncbi:MAG: hypothetical protein WBC49_02125 [Thermoplasmata archaeon]